MEMNGNLLSRIQVIAMMLVDVVIDDDAPNYTLLYNSVKQYKEISVSEAGVR
jgi:hypothetical protein